jgi:hypothetical protein
VIVGRLLDLDDLVLQAIPGTALALGTVCLVAGAAAYATANRTAVAVLALSIPVASIPFVSVRLMDAIGADRSARELAVSIEPTLTEQTQLVAVRTYPLSLPFYLRRTLILSTADGSELTSNFISRSYSRWVGSSESPFRPVDWWFDALTECIRPTVFVVRRNDTRVRRLLAARVPLIMETSRVAAYGPCGRSDLAAQPGNPEQTRAAESAD